MEVGGGLCARDATTAPSGRLPTRGHQSHNPLIVEIVITTPSQPTIWRPDHCGSECPMEDVEDGSDQGRPVVRPVEKAAIFEDRARRSASAAAPPSPARSQLDLHRLAGPLGAIAVKPAGPRDRRPWRPVRDRSRPENGLGKRLWMRRRSGSRRLSGPSCQTRALPDTPRTTSSSPATRPSKRVEGVQPEGRRARFIARPFAAGRVTPTFRQSCSSRLAIPTTMAPMIETCSSSGDGDIREITCGDGDDSNTSPNVRLSPLGWAAQAG